MSQIPLRLGTDEQFARAKEIFFRAGFQESGFGDGDGVEANERFEPYDDDNRVPAGASAAEVCTGLFLRGASAETAQLRAALGDGAGELLSELGLIETQQADRLAATARLRPMFGLLVASDLWSRTGDLAHDVVYPPDIGNTVRYLSFIPTSPCERFLEACGGSGVAALLAASRFAKQASSYDITDRSTRFAEFSGRLNGLPNFHVGCGDAYNPAGERTFDRIVAHPPYVPVLEPTWIYHGGGVDGEAVTRKLVEGLPKHLAPGGRFLCRCVGTDREGQQFQERIRWWLGEAEQDFDVALMVIEAINPVLYVTSSVLRGRSNQKDLPKWHRAFSDAGIVRFVSCFFVVQRRAEKRPVFTVRRDQGPNTGPRELEWLVQWETLRHSEGVAERILRSPLRAAAAKLRSFHELDGGAWAMKDQMLTIAHPFQVMWPVEPWTSYLLPHACASQTGAQLHALLRQEEIIHPEVTAAEFASALTEMISAGFLTLDGFEPPAPRV